jgi:hypothetical protein
MTAAYYTSEMWEGDHQTNILKKYGLDKEFSYGCDAIEKVAESLIVSRIWKKVLMSKLTPEQVHEAQSETEIEIRNYYKEKCKKQELI